MVSECKNSPLIWSIPRSLFCMWSLALFKLSLFVFISVTAWLSSDFLSPPLSIKTNSGRISLKLWASTAWRPRRFSGCLRFMLFESWFSPHCSEFFLLSCIPNVSLLSVRLPFGFITTKLLCELSPFFKLDICENPNSSIFLWLCPLDFGRDCRELCECRFKPIWGVLWSSLESLRPWSIGNIYFWPLFENLVLLSRSYPSAITRFVNAGCKSEWLLFYCIDWLWMLL